MNNDLKVKIRQDPSKAQSTVPHSPKSYSSGPALPQELLASNRTLQLSLVMFFSNFNLKPMLSQIILTSVSICSSL